MSGKRTLAAACKGKERVFRGDPREYPEGAPLMGLSCDRDPLSLQAHLMLLSDADKHHIRSFIRIHNTLAWERQ